MTRARVLLVEDDTTFQRYVVMALEDLPVELVAVDSIRAARDALATGGFAVLITDLSLPDGNGLDLLADLHTPGAPGRPPRTMVLSGTIPAASAMRALELGAYRVLEKPVPMQAIADGVRQGIAHGDSAAPPMAPDPRATAIADGFGGASRLFDTFEAASLAQFPDDLDAGAAACRTVDRAGLRRLAHSLKSVLALLGADEASSLARALEAGASDDAAAFSALEAQWWRLDAAIRELSSVRRAVGPASASSP